jgi:hypothetical protein
LTARRASIFRIISLAVVNGPQGTLVRVEVVGIFTDAATDFGGSFEVLLTVRNRRQTRRAFGVCFVTIGASLTGVSIDGVFGTIVNALAYCSNFTNAVFSEVVSFTFEAFRLDEAVVHFTKVDFGYRHALFWGFFVEIRFARFAIDIGLVFEAKLDLLFGVKETHTIIRFVVIILTHRTFVIGLIH